MLSAEKKRLPFLENELQTVEYKIKHLTNFYSYLQVRAWRARRRYIKKQISIIKAILKARETAPPVRYFWQDL